MSAKNKNVKALQSLLAWKISISNETFPMSKCQFGIDETWRALSGFIVLDFSAFPHIKAIKMFLLIKL